MSERIIPAPLWRRLAAALYDALLYAAIMLVITALDVAVRALTGLPFSPGALRGLWFLGGLAFFGWFWTHGGQTLGMRAWRLQVRRSDGRPLRWPTAIQRYGYAWLAWLPLGAGVLWSAVSRQRRGWHDRLSATEVVVLPKGGPASSPRAAP